MVQLMLSMKQLFVGQKRMRGSACALAAESAPADLSWGRVVREISTMQPYFSDRAQEAADFASAWSGGDDPSYLIEVETYAKSLNL